MRNIKSWLKPSIELVLACGLWGYGFVAAQVCLARFNESNLIFYRFLLAGIVALLILVATRPWHFWKSKNFLTSLKVSFFAGFWLFLCLYFQLAGLVYTTVSKSAFITVMYVIFIPLFSYFLGKKLSHSLLISVGLAIAGSALLSHLSFSEFNFGDFLTLLGCFAASIQIMYLEVGLKKVTFTPLAFHLWQCIWVCIFTAFISFCFSRDLQFPKNLNSSEITNFCVLILGPTLIAFLLQIRAQRKISAVFAGMIYLLESPFASFSAWIVINEKLDLTQVLGGSLIISACLFTIYLESINARSISAK